MTRFIMAGGRVDQSNRGRSAHPLGAAKIAFDENFAAGADELSGDETAPQGVDPIVTFEADPDEVDAKRGELPANVIVEKAILHFPFQPFAPLDLSAGVSGPLPLPPGHGSLEVTVVDSARNRLAGARVTGYFRGPNGEIAISESTTSRKGRAGFSFHRDWHPAALLVAPYAGYWPMFVRGPRASGLEVVCLDLPKAAPWWHDVVGLTAFDMSAGGGIRIGVVDTGCGPHPALAHVRLVGAFVDGQFDPGGGADIDVHGTHVCGAIGAHALSSAPDCHGLAPAAELFAARVFATMEQGTDQGDIARAVDTLSAQYAVHLINMSLGAPQASQILRDRILDAFDRGTLCVCAAGNDAPGLPAVQYPAAFTDCVAVSALGREGVAPPGTLSYERLPTDPAHFGRQGIFIANFSCHGPELGAAAPGVAMVAPVPSTPGLAEPFAAMDGTSMAAPLVCAALAAGLAKSTAYMSMPTARIRARTARQLLDSACQDVGLDPRYQGLGVCRA